MQNTERFALGSRVLARASWLGLGLLLGLASSCGIDDEDGSPESMIDSMGEVTADLDGVGTGRSDDSVCTTGWLRCHARVRGTADSGAGFRISAHAVPDGLGATDLQQAYSIDPSLLPANRPTVGIVIAFGYSTLEADLAKYREAYSLPPCTISNGCLKIVNTDGLTSPLPDEPPPNDDWTVETALDVDMASAGCPGCKILVVQADDNLGEGLFRGQATAARLGATVISNSWGGPEPIGATAEDMAPFEDTFAQPGIATFVAAGDDGYNDNGDGPDYPGTSAHAIAVGGTRLVRAANGRGWTETAWSKGGSACSNVISKPAYQTKSPCPFKATADVAAVGDPATGVAVYNSRANGWITVGGTSAASPLVAAIFAATGHGTEDSGAFLADLTTKLNDVTSGNNGDCGSGTILCNAGAGWDGPTGYGTPNARLLSPQVVEDPTPRVTGDVTGGCSTGTGSGGLVGMALALLGLRRRYRTARSDAAIS